MAQLSPADAIGNMIGGALEKSTRVEQFAQIALAKEQLDHLFQAIEALKLGAELMAIFEQMFRIQGIVEDVMNYEVPEDLVQEYEIINPLEHKRLTQERNLYMKEIDAEIAMLEKDIALDQNQFATLTMAMAAIEEPRSDIIATQAQFVADQSSQELRRRDVALSLLKAKRKEIAEQLLMAHRNSQAAALECIRAPVDVKC